MNRKCLDCGQFIKHGEPWEFLPNTQRLAHVDCSGYYLKKRDVLQDQKLSEHNALNLKKRKEETLK